MTTTTSTPTIILIAGHWLGAWAWDEVLHYLSTEHVDAIAMTLPGLDQHDPQRANRTLDDQAAAIVDVITQPEVSRGRPVIVVAHSGANAPVSLVLDRHPDRVHRVIWVDSGPVSAQSTLAPGISNDVTELPLPPFEILAEQASLEGLSTEMLDRFRARAVPEPGPVLRQPVVLTNDARREVKTTLVCCSIPSAQVRELAEAGHPMFSEVAKLAHLDVVDLPTGHWPMWSRPRDLAGALESVARRTD